MKRGLMLLSVLSLLFASTAGASVQQGDTELELLGGWITENGQEGIGDVDLLFASGAIGYFLTDNLQVAAAASGMWIDLSDEAPDIDLYAIGARAKWHFMPTNQWVPYIGAQIFWTNADLGDEDVDSTLWGPLAGLRYELNAYNDFFVEAQWHEWEGDVGRYIFDDGFAVFVGIVHQFK
jgi:hypothetical protein